MKVGVFFFYSAAVVVLGAVLPIAACTPGVPTCGVPGSAQGCPCLGGGAGVQNCTVAGSWSACDCAGDGGVADGGVLLPDDLDDAVPDDAPCYGAGCETEAGAPPALDDGVGTGTTYPCLTTPTEAYPPAQTQGWHSSAYDVSGTYIVAMADGTVLDAVGAHGSWSCYSTAICYGSRACPCVEQADGSHEVDCATGTTNPVYGSVNYADGLVCYNETCSSNSPCADPDLACHNQVTLEFRGSDGRVYHQRALHIAELLVDAGATVTRGTRIARIGNTGFSCTGSPTGTGNHGHISVYQWDAVREVWTAMRWWGWVAESCSDEPSSCAGLDDGLYCADHGPTGHDGPPSDLLRCSGGRVATSEPCGAGCEHRPPGVDDRCSTTCSPSCPACTTTSTPNGCGGSCPATCGSGGSYCSGATCITPCSPSCPACATTSTPNGCGGSCPATCGSGGSYCSGATCITPCSPSCPACTTTSTPNGCGGSCPATCGSGGSYCSGATCITPCSPSCPACTTTSTPNGCGGSCPATCGSGGSYCSGATCIAPCSPSCPACATTSTPNGCGGSCPATCSASCASGACVCSGGPGLYCGSSDGSSGAVGSSTNLYSCAGGSISLTRICAVSCNRMPAGTNDACSTSCPSGAGRYCGSTSVTPGGTSGSLFSCSNGVFTLVSACPRGCTQAAPGYDDYCTP